MFLSRSQVRQVDRRAVEEFGVPGVVLMENAGRGTAELLLRLGVHGKIVVCCGKGNNGGDGFVIARHLDNWRIPVQVLLFAPAEGLTGDAATNLHILQKSGVPLEEIRAANMLLEPLRSELTGADWVVDALFGTGLSGPVKPPFSDVIDAINQCGQKVLAVDIPSGLDCDTGNPLGATVRAHHTATFVAMKKGFANPSATTWTGQVHVIPIGAPREFQFVEDASG